MAFDAFLKIDGIKGESTDSKHKDEIILLSYNWGVSNAAGGASAAGGRGAGKASPSEFQIVKLIDAASPSLFQACASGLHSKDMTVTVRKAGGQQLEYLSYKFYDVMVSNYQMNGHAQGGDLPMESVSFNYSKVEIKYTPQDATGKGMSPVGSGYDFAKMVKV
jgi:type VI secretion system secreted protein Hcp